MNYSWVKFLAIIALFECTVIVTSYPYNNDSISVTESIALSRHKRQVVSIDPKATNLIAIAIAALMCVSPPPSEEKSCKINVKTLDFKHALIVDPNDHTKFLYPDENGDIYFAENQPVFLSCSGEGNAFTNVANKQFETFTCVCEETFKAGTNLYLFKDLTCQTFPKSDILDKGKIANVFDIVDGQAQFDYHRYDIGFVTDSENHFLDIINVIYYDDFSVTWYSKSVISKYLAGGQSTSAKTRFDQKLCCNGKNVNMDTVYNQDTQDTSFGYLLKSHTQVPIKDRYLKKNTDFVFNRGHLTPKSSMIYSAAGLATHAYLNVAPQWKKINSGNWGRIEEHIIEMAKKLKKDLTVYTGVYESLQLKDTADGDQLKPIYLYATKQRENIIREFPVSLYSYKLVIDLESKSGVVYVTVNDPYIRDGTQYHICNDPMIKKDGVKMPKQWKPKKYELGYSYMCTVSDFLSKTSLLPVDMAGLQINNLLYIPDGSQAPPTPAPVPTTTEFKRFTDELRKK